MADHHGPNPFDTVDEKTRERMRELFREASVGPTGAFPEGKMAKHDEGEIQFVIGHKDGKVMLEFGTPVAWLGMDPNQAKALGRALIQHGNKARIIGATPQPTKMTIKIGE